MSGAGAPGGDSQHDGAGSPRVQTASVAVAVTVIALVVALAGTAISSRPGAVVETRDVAIAPAGTSAAITGGNGDGPAAGGSTTSRSDARDRRGPASGPRAAAPQGAAGATQGSPTSGGSPGPGTITPNGTGPGGASDVAATGDAGRAGPETRTLELRPAEPGEWPVRVRVEDRASLVSGSEAADVDTTITVGPENAGAQRLDVDLRVLAVAGETVRYDGPGRRAFVIDVWTGATDPLHFTSPEGFLQVPAAVVVGRQWSWSGHTDDRRTSIDATTKVAGVRRTTFGDDDDLEVIELDQVIALGGDHAMTITRSVRYAPSLGLAIWLLEDVKGTNGQGNTLDRRVTMDLLGDRPTAGQVVANP